MIFSILSQKKQVYKLFILPFLDRILPPEKVRPVYGMLYIAEPQRRLPAGK